MKPLDPRQIRIRNALAITASAILIGLVNIAVTELYRMPLPEVHD
jgi:hypothetical protein